MTLTHDTVINVWPIVCVCKQLLLYARLGVTELSMVGSAGVLFEDGG